MQQEVFLAPGKMLCYSISGVSLGEYRKPCSTIMEAAARQLYIAILPSVASMYVFPLFQWLGPLTQINHIVPEAFDVVPKVG